MIADGDLVTRAQAGDRGAMDDLLRRHYDRIYAVCRRITGHEADAADAAQNALIAIVRSLAGFDRRAAFSTWAYRIATNASLDELRRRHRRPAPVLDAPVGDDTAIELTDDQAADVFDRFVDRTVLEAALTDVPEDYRIPVVLREVGDLDYQDIADQLQLPLGTVKSRIARGRSALAAAYQRRMSATQPSGNQPGSTERPSSAP